MNGSNPKAILVCVLAFAAIPASAQGSALSYDGTRYAFSGAPGENNDLRVLYGTDSFGAYIEFDDSNAISDGGGLGGQNCGTVGDSTKVRCDQVLNPLIQLGDELDSFGGDPTAGTPEEVYGGSGNDRLKGWNGNDLLDGGPGDDEFEKGDPVVRGGSDTIVGGDGFDTMNYRGDFGGAGPDPVVVSLDGTANDGAASENDDVQVEKVSGGEANDVLIGGPGPDQLFGDAGADEIRGGGGNDVLDGDTGDDRVFGEAGDDDVRGGDSSNDLVDGGPGRDNLVADGACFFIGCDSGGNDRIEARDGSQDTINCGGGADTAVVDRLDLFAQGGGFCEFVDRPAPDPAPDLSVPGPVSFKLKAPSVVRWSALAKKGLLVEIECTGQCAIDAGLFASARTADRFNLVARRAVRVARGRGSLNAAGKAKVRVRLTRKAKRRLAGARGLSLTLRVSVRGVGGARSSKSKKVRAKR